MSDVAATRPEQNAPLALAWMAGALASFSLVAVAGREAAKMMAAGAGRDQAVFADTLQIMFYRSAIGLVIVLALIAVSRVGFRQVATRRIGLHAGRNSVHFLAQFSWLHALSLIPLSQLFALEFTAPLWVALLAWLVLGERFTAVRAFAVALGFAGILIIVQPGMRTIDLGSGLALFSAIGFALSMIATKRLTSTETTLSILFHMSWMQVLVAGIISWSSLTWHSPTAFFWISLVGICGVSAHFCLARAFAHADAMIVAPMDFLRLPLITLVGAYVYGEAFEPAILIGAALIIAANGLNLWSQRRPVSRV